MPKTNRKPAVVKRNSQMKHLSNNLLRDTNAPTVNEDYITQVSDKLAGGGGWLNKCFSCLAGQKVGFQALCENRTFSF